MGDRARMVRLLGQKVAVKLTNVEARSVEIIATLEEVRDGGIVLSEIGELGPGPTLFCPWDSLGRVTDRPPWLWTPHEEPKPERVPLEQEFYELREATAEEVAPVPPVERREASARNLLRVVPIAQRRTIDEVTFALTSLELFGEGLGVLRYRISYVAGMFEVRHRFAGIPEPEFVGRDGSGRELPCSPQGWSGTESEADGDVEVRDLPETGELEVEVPRLVHLVFDEETGEERVDDSRDGPWSFRFSI